MLLVVLSEAVKHVAKAYSKLCHGLVVNASRTARPISRLCQFIDILTTAFWCCLHPVVAQVDLIRTNHFRMLDYGF